MLVTFDSSRLTKRIFASTLNSDVLLTVFYLRNLLALIYESAASYSIDYSVLKQSNYNSVAGSRSLFLGKMIVLQENL